MPARRYLLAGRLSAIVARETGAGYLSMVYAACRHGPVCRGMACGTVGGRRNVGE